MNAEIVNVAGVVLVHGHRVRSENLALHHLREAKDGVERRSQLVTYLREEPRFRNVGRFSPPARLIRNRLRSLEFADECVLFRARFERGEIGSSSKVDTPAVKNSLPPSAP